MSNDDKPMPAGLFAVGDAKEYKRVKYITYKDAKTFLAISSQPGVSFCLEANTEAEIDEQAQRSIDAYWKLQYREHTVPDVMREAGKQYMKHIELEKIKGSG